MMGHYSDEPFDPYRWEWALGDDEVFSKRDIHGGMSVMDCYDTAEQLNDYEEELKALIRFAGTSHQALLLLKGEGTGENFSAEQFAEAFAKAFEEMLEKRGLSLDEFKREWGQASDE